MLPEKTPMRLGEANLHCSRKKSTLLNQAYTILKQSENSSASIPQKHSDMPSHSSLTWKATVLAGVLLKCATLHVQMSAVYEKCKYRCQEQCSYKPCLQQMQGYLITFFISVTHNDVIVVQRKILRITCKIRRPVLHIVTSKHRASDKVAAWEKHLGTHLVISTPNCLQVSTIGQCASVQ